MSDTIARPSALDAAASAESREAWFDALDELTAEEGYVEPLGPRHWAFFTDAGTTLLVTFETLDSARARQGQMPFGHALAAERGWSHLCLLSDGETWFRDPAVYAYFDRQVDDAFFEDFDAVLFYGAGMGGYAACAYSVTAPGAQVLALSPPASLTPEVAVWDRRHLAARRLDFTTRYGYGPAMTEGAGQVALVHDPLVREEAMHAALYRAPWVTVLSARLLGGRVEAGLAGMGILPEMIDLAMAGRLDRAAFATLWRRRRAYGPWLQALLDRLEGAGQRERAIRMLRSVTARLRAPRFQRRLEKLTRGRTDAPVEGNLGGDPGGDPGEDAL